MRRIKENTHIIVFTIVVLLLVGGFTAIIWVAMEDAIRSDNERNDRITNIFVQSEGNVEIFIPRCTQELGLKFSTCADLVRGLYNEEVQ